MYGKNMVKITKNILTSLKFMVKLSIEISFILSCGACICQRVSEEKVCIALDRGILSVLGHHLMNTSCILICFYLTEKRTV